MILVGGLRGHFLGQNPVLHALAPALNLDIRDRIADMPRLQGKEEDSFTSKCLRTGLINGVSLFLSADLLARVGLITLSLTPANACLAAGALAAYSYTVNCDDGIFKLSSFTLASDLTSILRSVTWGVLTACAFGWSPIAIATIYSIETVLVKNRDLFPTVVKWTGSNQLDFLVISLRSSALGAALYTRNLPLVAASVAYLAADHLIGHFLLT